MSHTLKLVIPLALGLGAAVVNWMMLSSRAGTVQFVSVNRDIEEGEEFRPDDLVPLELPLQFAHLNETAIPFDKVGLLAGQSAQRSLGKGDVLFFRDTMIHGLEMMLAENEDLFFVDISDLPKTPKLLRIGAHIEFRIPIEASNPASELGWVGPFRIVSLDEQVRNEGNLMDQNRPPSIVTVAYNTEAVGMEKIARDRLEKFTDAQRTGRAVLRSIRVNLNHRSS